TGPVVGMAAQAPAPAEATPDARKPGDVLRSLWDPDSPDYPGYTPTRQTNGRPRTHVTEMKLKLCYDGYILEGNPASEVLADLEEKLGARYRYMEESHVRQSAKLWSARFEPPLPLDRPPYQ